jgi:hypothetical protein
MRQLTIGGLKNSLDKRGRPAGGWAEAVASVNN